MVSEKLNHLRRLKFLLALWLAPLKLLNTIRTPRQSKTRNRLADLLILFRDNNPAKRLPSMRAKKTDTFPVLAQAGTDIDSSKGQMLLEQYLGAQAVLLQV